MAQSVATRLVVVSNTAAKVVSQYVGTLAGASPLLEEATYAPSAAALSHYLMQCQWQRKSEYEEKQRDNSDADQATSDPISLSRRLAGRALTRCRELVLNEMPQASADEARVADLSCLGLGLLERSDGMYASVWSATRVGSQVLAPGTPSDRAVSIIASLVAGARSGGTEEELAGVEWTEIKEKVEAMAAEARPGSCLLLDDAGRFIDTGIGQDSDARVVMSGSFNPVHAGHVGLLLASQAHLRKTRTLKKVDAVFEIPIKNPDKGELDVRALLVRASQFAGRFPVALTLAPLFFDKAQCLPNSAFIVGMDTAVRLVDLKYYDGQPEKLQAGMQRVAGHGCSFLVFGRESNGHYEDSKDFAVPPGGEDIFLAAPRAVFEMTVSSTELRERGLRVAVR